MCAVTSASRIYQRVLTSNSCQYSCNNKFTLSQWVDGFTYPQLRGNFFGFLLFIFFSSFSSTSSSFRFSSAMSLLLLYTVLVFLILPFPLPHSLVLLWFDCELFLFCSHFPTVCMLLYHISFGFSLFLFFSLFNIALCQ